MGPPDLNTRVKILETILKDLKNNFNQEDIRAVAKITGNFSASDLGTIARNAARLSLGTVTQHLTATLSPDEIPEVTAEHFSKVVRGLTRSMNVEEMEAMNAWANRNKLA
ncbi:hypothetical protein RvY_00591 [Ramazzottius varieornatus]|uniref:AAA ATPase AAA+ lid domain-containing protein n=1 Tax=Ramazzottius varieornatus TaxID=947166 RepID=A0A1D1UN68_RAMVA|nr:hypothetical protein RvY_00591 [Ramazzottius varieornatus]